MEVEPRRENYQKKDPPIGVRRASKKSSELRAHYNSEVKKIRERHGSIDDMRESLGLTQRQFCKILLVDPSSYNRWRESRNGPPPSIWRSLGWLMDLRESDRDPSQIADLRADLEELKRKIELRDRMVYGALFGVGSLVTLSLLGWAVLY